MLITILAWLCLFFPATVHAGGTAYEDTLSGKTCAESRQQLNCEYKVGKDLEFSIDGIGMPDTGITFARSDYLKGDYYATFGLRHGCVVVKHGVDLRLFGLDFAFVSPKNGKVYKTWEECKGGM